jgi:cephalosporin hydroxylase
MQDFDIERDARLRANAIDNELQGHAHAFMVSSVRAKYSYNFSWLSRPIIQYPQDIVALQELIWRTRPDLVIECGIAHGGSLIMHASMLALLDYCDAAEHGGSVNPRTPKRRVVGVDIDIRPHNRAAIESHPLSSHIDLIEGSSVSPDTIRAVHRMGARFDRIMVCLDSNHTAAHVLAELEAYAPLTSPGSYCVVYDTIIGDLPDSLFHDRKWNSGDNPRTAICEYLRRLREEGRNAADASPLMFEVDVDMPAKLAITATPDGYLRRVSKTTA